MEKTEGCRTPCNESGALHRGGRPGRERVTHRFFRGRKITRSWRWKLAQVGVGIEPAAAAALDDGVDDGAALAGVGGADEEPVLLAERGGADGVFDQVVVDLQAAVGQVEQEGGPLAEGVVDRLAEQASGQDAPLLLPVAAAGSAAARGRAALSQGAGERPQLRAGAASRAVSLRSGKGFAGDGGRGPSGGSLGRWASKNLRRTCAQQPASSICRAAAGKGVVGGVAIALDVAGEVDGDDLLQAGGGAAGLPGIDGVGAGAMAGPKITELGLAVAGLEVADRRFVDLHIAARQDAARISS